jgi:Outer membrane protein beta-barrel family/CarboxypepD_reg-like domain
MKWIYIILLLLPMSSFAQQGTIRGKAIDNTSQKSVEFASVALLSVKDSSLVKGAMTDSSGVFELSNIKEGTYILTISSVEYQKVFRGPLMVNLQQPLLDLGQVTMMTDNRLLQEVVVSGSKPIFERKMGSIVMNLDSKLFKTSTNAIDVLMKAPGIQVKPDGSILMRNSIIPKVLIDGKVIPMNADELKNYLNNLRPDEIESIEIINTPSAKYDSEYKGIIDIKLKRDKNLGLSGSLSSILRQHQYGAAFNNLNLIYKTSKFAYTARLGYNRNGSFYGYYANQLLNNGNTLSTENEIPSFKNAFLAQVGVDYFLTKKQVIGVLLKAYNDNAEDFSRTNTSEITPKGKIVSILDTRNNGLPNGKNYSANLNYDGTFEHSQLTIAGAYSKYKNHDEQDIMVNDVESQKIRTGIKNNQNNEVEIKSLQLDYTLSSAKKKWEFGAKYANTTTTNGVRFDTLTTGNQYVFDAGRSNNFIYDEQITGGYINFSNESDKWSYQLGLRAEYTKTQANSITLESITNRDYLKWLPSINVNYTINENQSLAFAFTRRLRRPNFYEINPFIFYMGPYTYSVGNPYLIPSTTNSLSMTYSIKDVSFTLLGGKDEDNIDQLPFYDRNTNIISFLRKNFGDSHYGGLEIGYPQTITKWWKVQHNFNLYLNENKVAYLDRIYQATVFNYSFNGNQIFSLPKDYTLDLSYDYSSAGGDATYGWKDQGGVNIAIQKLFLSKKLNVKLGVNDIFYTNIPRAFSKLDGIVLNSYQKYATRQVRLQLTYNFGNSIYKAKQKTNSSAEEENRAKK